MNVFKGYGNGKLVWNRSWEDSAGISPRIVVLLTSLTQSFAMHPNGFFMLSGGRERVNLKGTG